MAAQIMDWKTLCSLSTDTEPAEARLVDWEILCSLATETSGARLMD